MSNISVRINDTLKNQMDKLPHLNWSEIIRTSIRDTITVEKERNLAKAVLLNERVRRKVNNGVNTTDIIRKFREDRK